MATKHGNKISLTCPFSIAFEVYRFPEPGTENIFIEPSENAAKELHENNEGRNGGESSTASHFSDRQLSRFAN